MLLYQFIETSATISTGSWSDNTHNLYGGVLLHVLVQAAADSTTFDFSITDKNGIVVKDWLRQTGELNEELYIPLKFINTLAIDNASTDVGTFKVLLSIDEGV